MPGGSEGDVSRTPEESISWGLGETSERFSSPIEFPSFGNLGGMGAGDLFGETTVGVGAAAGGEWLAGLQGVPQLSGLTSLVGGATGMLASFGNYFTFREPAPPMTDAERTKSRMSAKDYVKPWESETGQAGIPGELSANIRTQGVTYRLEMGEWSRFAQLIDPNRVYEIVRRRMESAGDLFINAARRLAPIDTGRLRDSLQTRWIDRATLEAGSDLSYSNDVEVGTPPHWVPIENLVGWASRHGMAAEALQQYIAHQGTAAHPFMQPAWDAVSPLMEDILSGVWDDVLEQHAARVGFKESPSLGHIEIG